MGEALPWRQRHRSVIPTARCCNRLRLAQGLSEHQPPGQCQMVGQRLGLCAEATRRLEALVGHRTSAKEV